MLLLSVLFSSLLLRIHLPAALLLGPLIAGLILSLRGVKLCIPRPCYLAAQAIVGCMIARAINPSVFGGAVQQLGAGAGDPVDHPWR
ncbi:AbrB family transcriptional regulator [Klebsiella pneumoniae subsp. pneumoniae]|nr:AbrB family transcriptional regulator [Klebsiella pneumoniae subsp. pneumoniae]